jgi:ankyrin repeat protein
MREANVIGMIREGKLEELRTVAINDFYDIEEEAGGHPILVAAKYGQLEICQYLIEQGARIDARVMGGVHEGLQPIHLAAKKGVGARALFCPCPGIL